MFRKGAQAPWQFLVHVVEHGGAMWQGFLSFRDHLRANSASASKYEELKRTLLAQRDEWCTGQDKEPFIRPILDSYR